VFSFYIPRIAVKACNTDFLSDIFEYMLIGKVYRIDFTTIKPTSFKKAHEQDGYFSAFVHMSEIFQSSVSTDILEAIQGSHGAAYKLRIGHDLCKFLILMKNHKPVTETCLNIHQVVENCVHLEQTLSSNSKTLTRLRSTVDSIAFQTANFPFLEDDAVDKTQQIGDVKQQLIQLTDETTQQSTQIEFLRKAVGLMIDLVLQGPQDKIKVKNVLYFGQPFADRPLLDETDDGSQSYWIQHHAQHI